MLTLVVVPAIAGTKTEDGTGRMREKEKPKSTIGTNMT